MFCTKCGNKLECDAKFCVKCGNKMDNDTEITTNQMGSITFVREHNFYGIIVPVKIFIDGKEVVSLAAGGTSKVSLSIGKHNIAFDVWSGNGENEIELTKEHPNIKVNFKLKMGAFSSKPTITSIENI